MASDIVRHHAVSRAATFAAGSPVRYETTDFLTGATMMARMLQENSLSPLAEVPHSGIFLE